MLFKPLLGVQLSGSIGGITLSHNRGGQYARIRSLPTQPNTPRQQLVKAALTGLVQAWDTVLTDAQRTGWNIYAANTPTINRIGDPLILTGQQFYIAVNTPRIQAKDSGLATGILRVDVAPVIYNTGEPASAVTAATIDLGILALTLNLAAPASTNGVALLFIGNPLNDGASFFKGPYQLAAFATLTATDPIIEFSADLALPDQWQADLIPVIDVRYPIRVRVAYDDARLSMPFRDVVEFAVTPV